MSSALEFFSEEIQIEATDFLKSLWTEGSDGSKLPKFSPEEVKEMAIQRFGHSGPPPSVVSHDFCKKWDKLSNTVRHHVEAEAASRKLERPLEELLRSGKLGISAAATVRGRYNLLKWEATGELEYLRQATDLLISAAVNGDPEAYYLLARYRPRQLACVMECNIGDTSSLGPDFESRWESKDQGTLHASGPEYLIPDEAERKNYFSKANEAGHELAWIEIEKRANQVIMADAERLEYDAIQREEWLKEDQSDTKRREIIIQRLRELASRSDAQELMLAKQLLEKTAHEFHGIDWDSPLRLEARTCLEKASRTLPEARYLLAIHYADLPDDEKLDLLRRAAYPENGTSPYAPAFGTLARAHVERGSLELAEQALRDQLVFSAAGKSGHDSAHYELAAFLRKNRASDPIKGDEALEICRALSSQSAWCAYCAALMLVERNKLEEARDFLKDARRGKTWPLFDEPDLVTVQTHAKVAEYLGWGEGPLSFESVVEILLVLLEKSGFNGTEKFLLSPEMASQLMEANPYYRKRQKEDFEEISRLTGVAAMERLSADDLINSHSLLGFYGKNSQALISGLLSALQPGLLEQEGMQTKLGGTALVSEYVVAQLLANGRFANSTKEEALVKFRQILSKVERRGYFFTPNTFKANIEQRIVDNSKRQEAQLRESWEKEEAERKLAQAKSEAMENMMAMFAHKFRGSVDTILFNTAHQHDERVYVDAARTMNGLLDIFSVVSTHPETLLSNLKEDKSGEGSPAGGVLHSIKLALVQLLSQRNRRRMSPHYLAYAKKHGDAPENLRLSEWTREKPWQELEKSLQNSWEQEVGGMIASASQDQLNEWMIAHLIPIRIDGFDESMVRFAQYGPKASLLTVIFTEVVVNAIKHARPSADEPIALSWCEHDEDIVFACTNPSSKESRTREASQGSGRGHKFLALIADHLQGRFDVDVFRDTSQVSMTLPSVAMKGVKA